MGVAFEMNHLKLKSWRLEVWTEAIRVDKIMTRRERLTNPSLLPLKGLPAGGWLFFRIN